jgi:hypothetical protein
MSLYLGLAWLLNAQRCPNCATLQFLTGSAHAVPIMLWPNIFEGSFRNGDPDAVQG